MLNGIVNRRTNSLQLRVRRFQTRLDACDADTIETGRLVMLIYCRIVKTTVDVWKVDTFRYPAIMLDESHFYGCCVKFMTCASVAYKYVCTLTAGRTVRAMYMSIPSPESRVPSPPGVPRVRQSLMYTRTARCTLHATRTRRG